MKIIIDTREQKPFTFAGYPCITETATLTSGDYSLEGFTHRIAVERKELNDLMGCLSSGRDRFKRELQRLSGYQSAVIVVESPFSSVTKGSYRSKLNPASATQSIISMMGEYRIQFWFAESRESAEAFTFDWLRHCHHHETRQD